ncbi:MAG: hypothetical protein RIE53_04590 [Rhodothermales bacterium]
MNSTETDLVCIDRAAQSDLMFWNLLGNALSTQTVRPPTFLIVEPGGMDEVVREERVREEVKEAVFRLTDLGVATVGFTGCDRKFIQLGGMEIRVGDWSILMDSAARNVVVLVASVACHPERGWVRIPPLEVARVVKDVVPGGIRLVHMVQRLAPELQHAGERGESVAAHALEAAGCMPAEGVHESVSDMYVHHVSRWAAWAPVPVSGMGLSSNNRLD